MGSAGEMYSDEWNIGEALGRDGDGVKLRAIKDELERKRGELKRGLDQGVKPEEFRRGQALLGSYDAALRGIESAWMKRYGRA